MKAAKMIKDLQDDWDSANKEIIEQTLLYNRKIWMLFYDTAVEDKGEGHDAQLRSNIVNLANFIFKREIEVLANPTKEKLDVLVNINREIAAGLMTNPDSAGVKIEEKDLPQASGTPPTAGEQTQTDTTS